jgi:drug/metabolite transporter (DMT)-like permease
MFKRIVSRFSSLLIRENINPWLFVLLLATILAAPSGTLSRLLCNELSPYAIVSVRYAVVALVLVPTFIRYYKKYKGIIKKHFKKIILVGFLASFGAPAFYMAVSLSSASFVAVIDLLTPILFIIISTIATKDKFSRNAIVGILLAVFGGSIILILPLIFNWSFMAVNLAAVLCMLVFIVIDASWPVALRKLNTAGVPLIMILAITFVETFIVSTILALTVEGPAIYTPLVTLPIWGWAIILFQAIGLSIAFRWLNTKAYEHLGTATTASVSYLYYALSIGLPLLLLGEELPAEILIGGVFIIIGIIFVRRHPHFHIHGAHHSR